MSWIARLFGQAPGPDERLAADLAIIAKCEKALKNPIATADARCFAQARLYSAQMRLQDTRNRIAKEAREAEIKAAHRAAPPPLRRHPADPIGRA